MLAPTVTGHRPRAALRGRWRRTRGVGVDLAMLALMIALCFAFLLQGGFETLIGGALGALAASRRGLVSTLSGAFAGLFAGALFAGFFHQALIYALSLVS